MNQNQNPLIHELLGTHEEAHQLFKTNPKEFERIRKQIIKEFIDNSPERNRQSLIKAIHAYDVKTRNIKDPLVLSTIASGLMTDSLFLLNDTLNGNNSATRNLISKTEESNTSDVKEKQVSSVVSIKKKLHKDKSDD